VFNHLSLVFSIAQYGFSLKPKHAASNKTYIISVVVDGWYSPSTVRVSQRDVIDKKRNISNSHRVLAGTHKGKFC